MRYLVVAVFLALPAGASAPDPFFDRGISAPSLPPAPKPPEGAVSPEKRKPTVVPPDLAAARPLVGNDAMLARLGPAAENASFTFGVLGDAEEGRFWWERLFTPGKTAFLDQWRALQASGVAFTLQLGDFVSEGNAKNYRAHVKVVAAEATRPILRTVGNHDRSRPNGDADKNLYDAVFGARDYFFDYGGWRFVSLDSSDRKVTASQLAWLKKTLAVPGPKVVFTHVPPDYLKKLKPLDTAAEFEAESESEKSGAVHDFFTNYFHDGSKEFDEIVTNGGVKAVYMGHIHAFWAADWRGVRYIISGGGGSPLYPLPPGYPKQRFAHTLRVTADKNGLTETVVPYKGAPFVLPPVKP